MKTFKYAIRYLFRSKTYTTINLIGLSFSLACCLLLVHYIHRELTVDTHCVDRENIYAVKMNMQGNSYLGEIKDKQSVGIDVSSIKNSTRILPSQNDFIINGEHRFVARTLGIDSLFFKFFDYKLLQGTTDMDIPESVWLMKDFADKVFGKENPVGKVIGYSNGKELVVKGILNQPENKTSINFDILVPISFVGGNMTPMEFYSFTEGTDVSKLNMEGNKQHKLYPSDADSREFTFEFIPVKDVYLDQSLKRELTDMIYGGNRFYLMITTGVCLLLFVTGLLNFVNIYLITLLKRGKEYGLKRVFGASGRNVFLQIWTENFLLMALSLVIAWLFMEIMIIPLGDMLDITYEYKMFDFLSALAILIVVPILTSFYPNWKYSNTSPVLSIRSVSLSISSVRMRKVFLSVQYVLTFLLLSMSFYFNNQLEVMLNTEPGFRTKDVIIANLVYESKDFQSYTPEYMQQRMQRVSAIDAKLSSCPDIEQWEASYIDILNGDYESNFFNGEGQKFTLNMRLASPRFFDLYDIRFQECASGDKLSFDGAFCVAVLNRAAMDLLGYDNIQGAVITEETPMMSRGRQNATFPVVAVVEDYYGGHLSLGKKPTVFFVMENISGDFYQIACVPGKVKNVLSYLEKVEKDVYGSGDFSYTMLEDDVAKLYANDRRIANIYTVFAIVAIVVSCLGLFGISLFDMRQHYKEIAIRKINGAGFKEINLMFLRKYLMLLIISFIVSIPLSLMLIFSYTDNFVVKAPVGIDIFLFAFVIVTVISLGTLYWQVHKAASINPAETIKTE
ncbi:MAG: FtsX-like permease family protein [Parabacteroides sp.]|nr:FtsX-like permease family protein [Parabacteroides sp.]